MSKNKVKHLDKQGQLELVYKFVEQYHGIKSENLYEKSRKPEIANARFMAFYILHFIFKWEYTVIARHFHKHHSSVMHGSKKVVARQWDLGVINQVAELAIKI